MRKLLFTAVLSVFLLPAIAQTQKEKPPTPDFYFRLNDIAMGSASSSQAFTGQPIEKERLEQMTSELAREYMKAPRTPQITDYVLKKTIEQMYFGVARSKSAEQASQVCNENSLRLQIIQLAQNQRIIELLEQMANKK